MPFEIMMEQWYKCELLAIESHVKIEEDPNFISWIKVIYYKNIFSYLCYLLNNRMAIIYSNSLTIKTLLVGLVWKNTFFYAHSYNFWTNFFKKNIIQFFYRCYTKVRVNNIDELREINNIQSDLWYICPLVVSRNYFCDNLKNRSNAVFIWNLTDIKNPEFLIETCHILKKKNIDFRVDIIWEDRYDKNGISFWELVQKNKLEEYIVLHGFLQPEQIKEELNTSLIYINTSISEWQCLAVYEWALSGNILCLPNIISFPSVFWQNALYHSSPQELADNIIIILKNKTSYNESIEKNQKTILKEYSYTTIRKQLYNLFLN